MATNETSFTINVTAASGENYAGTFIVRRRLSHMQTLRRDELRRELLGSKPDAAPDSLKQNAYILSTCAAYVKEAPSWWTNASNGVDLLDEEPVGAVFQEILKIQDQLNKELEEKAEKAKLALKAI